MRNACVFWPLCPLKKSVAARHNTSFHSFKCYKFHLLYLIGWYLKGFGKQDYRWGRNHQQAQSTMSRELLKVENASSIISWELGRNGIPPAACSRLPPTSPPHRVFSTAHGIDPTLRAWRVDLVRNTTAADIHLSSRVIGQLQQQQRAAAVTLTEYKMYQNVTDESTNSKQQSAFWPKGHLKLYFRCCLLYLFYFRASLLVM